MNKESNNYDKIHKHKEMNKKAETASKGLNEPNMIEVNLVEMYRRFDPTLKNLFNEFYQISLNSHMNEMHKRIKEKIDKTFLKEKQDLYNLKFKNTQEELIIEKILKLVSPRENDVDVTKCEDNQIKTPFDESEDEEFEEISGSSNVNLTINKQSNFTFRFKNKNNENSLSAISVKEEIEIMKDFYLDQKMVNKLYKNVPKKNQNYEDSIDDKNMTEEEKNYEQTLEIFKKLNKYNFDNNFIRTFQKNLVKPSKGIFFI